MAVPLRSDAVKILVVDDQPSKLLTYDAILSELGEELIRANSASEALEALLKHEIAVVLADVCMPDLDGYELAAMIRQHPRCQKTSIIFVSAVMMAEPDRLRGYQSGAVDYVPVPVVPEILRAKVKVFAELYRKTRALEELNAELERRVAARTGELEATTAALREADRRKDEFLAMLAHELRNPLAPIRTAVQLLRLKELPEAHSIRARDTIDRQVEHLVCLIDDLLDVSRITRGMITLQREPVPASAIVARAIEITRPAIDAKRHELVLDLADDPLTIEGDRTRLVQIVGNILHNATKFMDPGGCIVLRITQSGSTALITVKDEGIGIPADRIDRVFDLFTQVHRDGDMSQGGLGIGLALVRRLVEMHGGSVEARSDGPGRGTEIRVCLPLSTALLSGEAGTPQVDAEPLPPQERRRILIADDNGDAAGALALRLELAGHEVRTAQDGLEALAVARTFQPEVVLLDLGMPAMDGYETARHLRRLSWGKQARLIALTGWGQQQDRIRTAEAGFDIHLVKPVSELDLFRAIASADAAAPSRAN
ncbi:MAG: response regulator [Vicinamibacteraceae bacterium]